MCSMRNSLVTRVTSAYVLLAGTLVVFTCLVSVAFALHEGVVKVDSLLSNRRAELRDTADALAVDGRPFRDIARVIGNQQRVGLVVQVLDSKKHVVAGPATPYRHSFTLALASLFGVHPLEFAIPGGTVRITRDPERFGAELRRYVLFNTPIALVAIILAWWAGRRITLQALRPLGGVTSALKALSEGDFSAKALTALDQTEVATLVDAFNSATASVANAMGQRDRAQLDLRRFVADAGHELRTPLTVIIGYIDALRHGIVADPSDMAEILEAVNGESQRMRRIVEDLIMLAWLDHQGAHQQDVVALRDVFCGVLNAFASQDRQRIRDAGGDAIVQVDALAIQRAMRNILDNALRYSQGIVAVRIGRDGTFALLTVEDQGPGMNEDDVLMAFERFHRGRHKADIEGTGLGLAIVKTAVEASGGTVTLRSSPKDGTSVVLRIPLATSIDIHMDATLTAVAS